MESLTGYGVWMKPIYDMPGFNTHSVHYGDHHHDHRVWCRYFSCG